MKIKLGKLFVATMVTFLTAILANSVHAQWTIIGQPTLDNKGREVRRNERHINGAIRAMTRVYHPNSNVVALEKVTTTAKDGSQILIEERRDNYNRVTLLMNLFYNRGAVMVRGVQQWWSYRNTSDRYGKQQNFRYNARTDSWVSF